MPRQYFSSLPWKTVDCEVAVRDARPPQGRQRSARPVRPLWIRSFKWTSGSGNAANAQFRPFIQSLFNSILWSTWPMVLRCYRRAIRGCSKMPCAGCLGNHPEPPKPAVNNGLRSRPFAEDCDLVRLSFRHEQMSLSPRNVLAAREGQIQDRGTGAIEVH